MTSILWIALSTAIAAEGGDAKASAAELERFNGTWKGVSVVEDGKAMPRDEAEAVRLVVTGEKYALKLGGQDIEGTHRLDPTKSPKEIEAVRTRGPHRGEKMLGIYELSADSFKVCFAAPGKKERPREFKSEAGSGQRVLTLRRDKK